MKETRFVLKDKYGETNKDRSILELEQKRHLRKSGDTIEVLKEIPRADGWDKLPTIGDIKGMNDFGGEW